jgi:formylglycine-generating enzyme required for sulfatase activity
VKAAALVLAALLPALLFGQQGDWVRIPAGGAVDRPFELMRTEVTVAEFGRFVEAAGYRTVAERAGVERTWRTPGFKVEPKQPVVLVAVEDAEAYCGWVGGRLPLEAEWEHAARAGSRTKFYWGEELDRRHVWFRENSEDRPQAVGTKRANAWGLRDMTGNVWEWALVGNAEGDRLASRRGGSWVSCGHHLGVEVRYAVPVKLGHRHDDIGFRCAREVQ